MQLLILISAVGGVAGAYLGIGSSDKVYKDPKLTYFAHNQLGDTFGSDLTIEEEDEKKSLELEGNSTKYIKITNTIQIPETESIRMIMDILKVIWEAILTGITRGFMPTMERYRRDTSSSHRGFLLDWILDIVGALIGRQECSQRIACRTGRLAQEKLPGSQMIVVMMESFVPPALLHWFSILKNGVLSSFYPCDTAYPCDFISSD